MASILSWRASSQQLPFIWQLQAIKRGGVTRFEMRAKPADFARAIARAEFSEARSKRKK